MAQSVDLREREANQSPTINNTQQSLSSRQGNES
jgi:hypothetical protein